MVNDPMSRCGRKTVVSHKLNGYVKAVKLSVSNI